MRVKSQRTKTEDGISQHTECIRKLCHDIHAFTATADRAVVSLYAISQICWSNFGSGDIQRDLASNLMAVVGALSSLRLLLDGTPELTLLSSSDVDILMQNVNKCEPIVHKIEAAVQKLDGYLVAQPEKNTRIQPPGLYNAFNPGSEIGPENTLSECFLAIMHATVTAKVELLSGTHHLTSSESSEAFRFKQALPNSDLQAPVKRSIPFTCSNSARQGTNTASTQSSTLFHTQPPNQYQPAQPHLTPSSLWNFKPWLNSADNSPTPPPRITASKTMAFGKPNIDGSNATPTVWNALGTQNQQHLEAYILRTTVKSLQHSSITWSYAIDLLPLDNDAMVAHTKKMGSGYSIVDAIGELYPEQLRRVQERTKARDGKLVSVQFGVPADVVTVMGTFKIKPVIFVVKTAAEPVGSKSIFNTASFPNSSFPAATGSLLGAPARATSGGLFGMTNPLGPPAKPTQSGLFGTATNYLGPPTSASNLPLNNSFTSGPCFHAEKNGLYGTDHFMSISCAALYENKSFEEIRLDDIKAGRVPSKALLSTGVVFDEAPVSKSVFAAPKLFVNAPPFAMAFQPQPRASDATTADPQPGAFGSTTAKTQPGVLGATTTKPQPISSGLFCTPTVGSQPGTFGATNRKQTLFGKATYTSQYRQRNSDSAEAPDTAALANSAFGSSKPSISTNTFGFGGHLDPVIAPAKAASESTAQAPTELNASPSKANTEETKTPDVTCRKCAAPALYNSQSIGLCLACASKETTCWLCHDPSEASRDTVAPKDTVTSKITAAPKYTVVLIGEKRERSPSSSTGLFSETGSERKLKPEAENSISDKETKETSSTPNDLLPKCQVI